MICSFRTIMCALCVATISVGSCHTKIYPDEKLAIAPDFLSMFNAVVKKDTIRFTNLSGNNKTFFITSVDSIISNKKALMINEAPYKLLRLIFREIGNDTIHLERENEIFVNKNPVKNQNSIGIQFNNLYYHDTLLPPLHHDTLQLNAKRFTNYYSFETSLASKNPGDVTVLYIKITNGFLGFKTRSGELWVNNEMK